MGEIVLIRHGQANSSARSEADYDRLSPLGHQQARWLGDWLREYEPGFDQIIAGGLRRHGETAAGLGIEAPEIDTRLNELDYFALARDMETLRGLPFPGPGDWPAHMRQTFEAWEAAEIAGAESFAGFESRIRAVMAAASRPGLRILCITSGGVIGTMMRLVLGLPVSSTPQLILPVGHTSITRLRVGTEGAFLHSFNAIPHLDAPNRQAARTWI